MPQSLFLFFPVLPELPVVLFAQPRTGVDLFRVEVLAVKRNFANRSPAPVLPSSGKRGPTVSRSGRGIGAIIETVYIISRFPPRLSPGFSQNPCARLQFATGGIDMQKQNKIRDGIWLDACSGVWRYRFGEIENAKLSLHRR